MIEQQDSKLFVNQIEYLIKDEELYQTIVKNARVFANQFDSKEKTKELVDFYYQILS
jgi:glycosyltransferase involved in cell wall biosynthesis